MNPFMCFYLRLLNVTIRPPHSILELLYLLKNGIAEVYPHPCVSVILTHF